MNHLLILKSIYSINQYVWNPPRDFYDFSPSLPFSLDSDVALSENPSLTTPSVCPFPQPAYQTLFYLLSRIMA